MSALDLSLCTGGVTSTSLTPYTPTFPQLYEKLSNPAVGDKDGPYFVRGPAPVRNDIALSHAEIAVLDGDSTVDTDSGLITSGAPDPEAVHLVLKERGIAHVIHSTYSNDVGHHRYRVIIPIQLSSPEELRLTVDYLIGILHQRDVMLAPVSENYRWSQPWYLPRIRKSKLDLYREFYHG